MDTKLPLETIPPSRLFLFNALLFHDDNTMRNYSVETIFDAGEEYYK
jgi:hypothetical protein